MITISLYASPVGILRLAARGEALTGLWLVGQKYDASTLNDAVTEGETPALISAKRWLDCYFAGKKPDSHGLVLSPDGSAFRRAVWDILCTIPYGTTTSYGAIAREMARRQGKEHFSAQAVGGAVGHNPISLVIPCHRVVGADGSLTGYAGGLAVKRALLTFENAEGVMPLFPREEMNGQWDK